MAKSYLTLQESEGIVVQSASRIYSAYIVAGKVGEGQEAEFIERSIREAIRIAKITDATIVSDGEMD